jgi:hypothetical protein
MTLPRHLNAGARIMPRIDSELRIVGLPMPASEVSEALRIFGDSESGWHAAALIGSCYPTDPSGSFNGVSSAVMLARFLRCKG